MIEKQLLRDKLNQCEDEMRTIIENLDNQEQTIAKLKEREAETAFKFDQEMSLASSVPKSYNLVEDEEADRAEDERLAKIMRDV